MKFLKPLVGLLALQKAAGLNHDTSSSDGRMDLQSPSNPLNVGGQEGVFSQIMTVDGAVALNDELDHSFYFAEAEKKRSLLYESTNAEDRKIYSEELLSLINKAIELNPEEKNQYHFRGQAYLHLGENDKALIDFQKEIEINPNYASYHEMGIIYTRTGDLEKADEFLSKAIKIEIFKGAYYNRGIVYEKMGYPRKALEDFNKELEINPSFQEAIHRQENNPSLPHFEHEEEFIAAKKYFEEFLKDKESGFDADNLVKVADRAIDSFYGHSYNKGIWDTRVSPIENVNKFATPLEKELIEEYLSFKEMVCDTLSKQEKDAEAISVRKKQAEASFADIVAIRPAALQERHDRGRKYFREDRKQDALDDFDKIILLEPQKTWVNYDRATVLYSNGDNHGAIESFTKEIDLNRDSLSHAYEQRSMSYFNLLDQKNTLLDLNRAIKTNHSSEERKRLRELQTRAKFHFVSSFEESGNIEKLNDFLDDDVIGSNIDLRVKKAEACASLGRDDESINHYKLAIAIGANHRDKLYLKMAELHQNLGNNEEALHDLDESIKIKPSSEAYLEKSHVNWQLGMYNEAIKDYLRSDRDGFSSSMIILTALVGMSATAFTAAILAVQAYERNNPPVIEENNPPAIEANNLPAIDINETYPREIYKPSINGYVRDQLQYSVSYEDMSEEEGGEIQKNAIFNLGKESFARIVKKIFNIRYDAVCSHGTKDGKDCLILDFSIGHFDNDPYFKERFVSEIEFPENTNREQKMEFVKNATRKEVVDFLNSFAEDLLYEVKNDEEKESLKSILIRCLQDSHNNCDITLKYNIRGVERDKNMLYDRIAKSGDYTIIDPDKLADGKAIFREAALEYLMDIYEKIAEEKALNQAEQKDVPKVEIKAEEKFNLKSTSQREMN